MDVILEFRTGIFLYDLLKMDLLIKLFINEEGETDKLANELDLRVHLHEQTTRCYLQKVQADQGSLVHLAVQADQQYHADQPIPEDLRDLVDPEGKKTNSRKPNYQDGDTYLFGLFITLKEAFLFKQL